MKPSCSISRDDGFVAQYIWIALSGPGQGDELIGDGPPNMVVVVPSAQGNAGHLESYTQSTAGLQVEIIRAFEIGRDWHGCAPLVAWQAGAQSVSQPSVPDCWLLLANHGKQLTPKSASDNQVRIPSADKWGYY